MRLGTPKLCPFASEQTGHTMGKTRDLFLEEENWRYQGIILSKDEHDKRQKSEEIKKRWQEYTEE